MKWGKPTWPYTGNKHAFPDDGGKSLCGRVTVSRLELDLSALKADTVCMTCQKIADKQASPNDAEETP